MNDPKIEALTQGFLAAGESEADIPRLVEEHYETARLVGNGEGGLMAEIRRSDGTYATPTTAKYLANSTPKDEAARRRGMEEWIAARNAGVINPGAAKPLPPAPEPPPLPPTPEERTAEYVKMRRAAKNPEANSLDLSKPWGDLSAEEYRARRKAGLFPDC